MNDSELIDLMGGTAVVAKRVGARMASVSEWRVSGIPEARRIQLGAAIEKVGGGKRWEQRPTDWFDIWPELVGAEGAPQIATAQEAG